MECQCILEQVAASLRPAEGHAEDRGLLQGRASAQAVKLRFGKCSWSSQNPIHISNMVLPTVKSGPPEEARTPRKDRGTKDHRAPNHISKTVPPTVQLSPPYWTRTGSRIQNGLLLPIVTTEHIVPWVHNPNVGNYDGAGWDRFPNSVLADCPFKGGEVRHTEWPLGKTT